MSASVIPLSTKLIKTPTPCFECEEGMLSSFVEDYEVITSDMNRIIVPKVELIRCDKCKETLIPAASSRYISEFQAQTTEQVSRQELKRFVEQSGLTQKDYAESLGLGEQILIHWLNGTMIVPRSMGYYLRSIQQFPEVFDWVKCRGWRSPA